MIVGGIVAIGFGVAVYFTSSQARTKSLEQRPLTDRRAAISARIRDLLDQEASAKTAEANERAGHANEAAESASERAAIAAKGAAEANKAAADANHAAESERLERVRLEAQVAPRRLTPGQQSQIAQQCLGLSGRRIVVRSYQLDVEGYVLAQQIVDALEKTGFNIAPQLGSFQVTGKPDEGVQVRAAPSDLLFAVCLANALRDIGRLTVTVNGPLRENDPILTNAFVSMGGEGKVRPPGPLPEGYPPTILVGVKPLMSAAVP